MRVAYGFAFKHGNEPCAVNTDHPSRTLCGRTVEFLPEVQAFGGADGIPLNLHPRCRQLLANVDVVPAVVDPPYGTCPQCWGDVPLEGGLVAAHGAWVVGRHGPAVSDTPCDGVGARPEVQA